MRNLKKYRSVILSCFAALLLVFVGQTLLLLINIADMVSTSVVVADSRDTLKGSVSDTPVHAGKYETIQQTMTRLRRDVLVTGTLLGIPGEESAMFRIEGMPDRQFKLHSQLMDGFIIQRITSTEVVLKHQRGVETLVLNVSRS